MTEAVSDKRMSRFASKEEMISELLADVERLERERSELMKLLNKAYEFISNGTDPEVATEDEFRWFERYKAVRKEVLSDE